MLQNPQAYRRRTAADHDHSWTAQGVDPDTRIAEIAAQHPEIAAILGLQQHFGLRLQEACLLRPAQDHHGDFIRIVAGTKGGRPRVVPVETDAQRQCLHKAHALAAGRSLIPPEHSLKSWLAHCYHVFCRYGLTRRQGLVSHGLRHQYANDQYEMRTGEASPVRGGDGIEHQQAAADVSARLGHARVSITRAYYGESRSKPATESATVHAKAEHTVHDRHLMVRLNGLIDRDQHGRRVTAATLATREQGVRRLLKQWVRLGCPLHTPDQLSPMHIDRYFADDDRHLAQSTRQKRIQLLVQLCRWLQRPELVAYIHTCRQTPHPSPALPHPQADIDHRLARIRAHCPRIAAQVNLVRVLGLTHHQAALLQPHRSYSDGVLDVYWASPRGYVQRRVLKQAHQRAVVGDAKALLSAPDGALCPADQRLAQWMRRVHAVLRAYGRIGVAGEPNLKALRDPHAPVPIWIPVDHWWAQRCGLIRPGQG